MAWSWHPVQLSLVVASIATVIVFAFAIISVFWMTEKNVKGRAIIELSFSCRLCYRRQ
ncbi:hypothetical protein [Virgibacillus pantothenticus]|uniref:hypothetical protein n=1 Tax=Virgibacillus pantothenticus TaxID=1473 RepID=UPI002E1EAEBB